MTFYQALQLDPGMLKRHIKESQGPREKLWFLGALVLRDLLLVGFAILFISLLSAVFGQENSSFLVVLFCMILSIRFVHFSYRIQDSLLALAVVFLVLLLSPLAIQLAGMPPLVSFGINLISLLLLVVLTCESPEMGNGGLYLFGYIFLTGGQISIHSFWLRCGLALLGYLICAVILFVRHGHRHQEVELRHIFQRFDLRTRKSQWQLQLALGISLLFLINDFFPMDHFIWAGFACSSLLSSYHGSLHERFWHRISGVFIGSAIFMVLYLVIPPSYLFLFGPISGLCLGLCTQYRYKNVFNCLGALSLGAVIYGMEKAAYLRVFNNLFGLVFGLAFFYLFQHVMVRGMGGSSEENT